MRKLVSVTTILSLMIVVGAANAAPPCPYDVVGQTFTDPYRFLPDGLVTYNVPNSPWWESDTLACYETYQNPAYLYYFPGCDLDGSGDVSFDEVWEIYQYATQHGGSATPCPAGCESDAECGADQYCNFSEQAQCGAAGYGHCTDKTWGCMTNYLPVCGCDGVTYSSDCYAAKAGMSVAYDGECQVDPCADMGTVEPGANPHPLGYGVSNGECRMIFGTEVPAGGTIHASAKDCAITCPHADPGCASNDECNADQYCKFYDDSECGTIYKGTCVQRNQMCITIYEPVCGCDGNTYSSDCYAGIHGATVDYDGECTE